MTDLLLAAYDLSRSNARGSPGDIVLIGDVLKELPDNPVVIQVGASDHGIFVLSVLAREPKADIYIIDLKEEALHWQMAALEPAGLGHLRDRQSNNADQAKAALPAELIIIDPCPGHDYQSVTETLAVWTPRLGLRGFLFMHDCVATSDAPHPEVIVACRDYFKLPPWGTAGWSAVWRRPL